MTAVRPASALRKLLPVLLLAFLAGCGGGGGGGGGDDGGGTPPPISGNFFPLAVGDRWFYADGSGGSASVRATGTRRVDGQDGIVVGVDSAVDGHSESVYLVGSSGVRQVPVAGSDPVMQAIGSLELMRFPLVPGDTFVQIDRSLSSGTDFDGDGRIEQATVRSTVTVLAPETVAVPAGSFPGSVHLRTAMTIDVRLTGLYETVRVETTLDDWYAPDIGPVRSVLTTRAEGSTDTVTLALTAYRVGARRSESAPPALVTATPADGSIAGITASVRAVFDEPLDPATAAAGLALIDAAGHAVTGSVEVGIDSLAFWPAAPLASGRYTAQLAPTVADALGNALGSTRSWSFTIDAQGPQVLAVTPAPGSTDVAREPTLVVRFDEALDAATLAVNDIVLRSLLGGDTTVRASVAGDTLTVVPTAPLARGEEYALVFGAFSGRGPGDLQGNFAAGGVVTQFRVDPGRFAASVPLLPDFVADAVALGDVNGDGRRDVVAAMGYHADDAWAFRLAVFAQQADGRLGTTPTWVATQATYACRPTSVAIGDVDGDGRDDVLVAEFGCGIEIFRQGGDGRLQPGVLLATPQSYLVRLADFNGDGRLDLLSAGWNDTVVQIWRQSGGTLVAAATPRVEYQGWDHLATGDLDGDGRIDIALASGQGDHTRTLGVLLQRPDGSFADAVYGAGAPWTWPSGVAIGDVDGDGRAELLASFGNQLRTWRTTAGGALVEGAAIATADRAGPIVLADVNGDGRRDMVVAHPGGGRIGLHLQTTGGGLAPELDYGSYNPGAQPDMLAVGDVNGDGRPDLVLNNGVMLQRPVGQFAEGVPTPGPGIAGVLRQAVESRR